MIPLLGETLVENSFALTYRKLILGYGGHRVLFLINLFDLFNVLIRCGLVLTFKQFEFELLFKFLLMICGTDKIVLCFDHSYCTCNY